MSKILLFLTQWTFDQILSHGDIFRLVIHPYRFYYTYWNIFSMDASFYPILPSEVFFVRWTANHNVVASLLCRCMYVLLQPSCNYVASMQCCSKSLKLQQVCKATARMHWCRKCVIVLPQGGTLIFSSYVGSGPASTVHQKNIRNFKHPKNYFKSEKTLKCTEMTLKYSPIL